jgi:hypothetical protein
VAWFTYESDAHAWGENSVRSSASCKHGSALRQNSVLRARAAEHFSSPAMSLIAVAPRFSSVARGSAVTVHVRGPQRRG